MNTVFLWSRIVGGCTTVFLLTLAISATAQTTQKMPQSDRSSGDSGGNKTIIATVFGEPLYLEQLTPADAEVRRNELPPSEFDAWLRVYHVARTHDNVWAAVSRRYLERERLDVTEEEMNGIIESAERNLRLMPGDSSDSPFPSVEQKGIAVAFSRASFIDWKICKSLYEKYGGRVGIGSLGAWIAIDGQHALLKVHQEAGDIKFHHAEIETAFWEYAQRENFADAYPKGERLRQLLATPPYQRDNATARVEPNQRERIGSVLGRDIYRDQLQDNPPTYHQVAQLFMAPAMEEFEQAHESEFEMTDAEIFAGVAWTEAERQKQGGAAWEHWQSRSTELKASVDQRLAEIQLQLDDPTTPKNQHPLLKTALRVTALEATHPHAGEVWFIFHSRKLEKFLYSNYGGGRIIHQQFGPEALDARRKVLLKLEEAGKFQITDPELRKLAYDYWERPNHPGGFHTDHRLLMFPWTEAYQEVIRENEGPPPATIK